jgi:transcriptional regulator with XRE-family HTH domain
MMEMTVGERIKKLMKEKRMTQLILAEETGIPQSTISKIVSAKRAKDVKEEHLAKIVLALGLTEKQLLENEDSTMETNASEERHLLQARYFQISDKERLDNMNANGVISIHQDRAEAFRVFYPIWRVEPMIRIVGSSIEGFKRGIGIDAEGLLRPKLEEPEPKKSRIQIILTHAEFAQYREKQEGEDDDYIVTQIRDTTRLLEELRASTNAGDRLQWKYFCGAPTCFMIIAGDYMLLNPYLYMQPGYFNFSIIVRKTAQSVFDIYSRYELYHFTKAWNNPKLCVDDSGLPEEEENRSNKI